MSSRKVLLVCASSVTRALLSSLLASRGDEVSVADSLPRAVSLMEGFQPHAVIVEASIVRASPDALDRLRHATTGPVALLLADRGYSDERRGAAEMRAFGAGGFLPVPPDSATLENAINGAIGETSKASVAAPALESEQGTASLPPADGEQMARYIERLWSRLGTLDAYQLLRVSSSASDLEIKAAFRERALEFHPDRQHPGLDEEARERVYQIFKRVSWAFRKVGEPTARKEYNLAQQKTAL